MESTEKSNFIYSFRNNYQPAKIGIFKNHLENIIPKKESLLSNSKQDNPKIKELFPHTCHKPIINFINNKISQKLKPIRIGVLFSGGQAPGGHNVIYGIYSSMVSIAPDCKLMGFIKGIEGLLKNEFLFIKKEMVESYKNTGGFDMLGSSRKKIETQEEMQKIMQQCQKNSIDGLVIIGGDDSNTNAAILAEFFANNNQETSVIGIPKTIDGDLKNEYIPISFGFDTATKTYSNSIANIAKDALSSKKYWHFIKLMGRSASHIALECAINTQPNACIISEEVLQKKQSLDTIVQNLANIIYERQKNQYYFGIVLIPEGLIEFIPEFQTLIQNISEIIDKDKFSNPEKLKLLAQNLSPENAKLFNSLPQVIQKQLILDRDPHGNLQVSKIEVDRLLMQMVTNYLHKNFPDAVKKFQPVQHFLGYEGRSAFPSNFDAKYCYNLGYAASLFIIHKLNGYMVTIQNLSNIYPDYWTLSAVPITNMLIMEKRKGKEKPVIKKFLVDLNSKIFQYFIDNREAWAKKNLYKPYPPIQFKGDPEVTEKTAHILSLSKE